MIGKNVKVVSTRHHGKTGIIIEEYSAGILDSEPVVIVEYNNPGNGNTRGMFLLSEIIFI